jgi:lipopolysaccharide biosynthesis glycosyltransferase
MNPLNKIYLIVGFDQREAVAYHTFCQSVIEKSSLPVLFMPLSLHALKGYKESHQDGSNTFIYSRFLSPYLMGYEGWAIFADGDMVCKTDIAELWDKRDATKAVQVVKHNYQTKAPQKYLGNKNENYPRKNWSSLVLWNCGHPKNKILTPEFIEEHQGSFLHGFSWLNDSEIGELNMEWNWLAIEYEENTNAKLIHYTLGTPCWTEYSSTSMSDEWHQALKRSLEGLNQ